MSEIVFSRVVLEKNNQILAILVLGSFALNILLGGLLVSTTHRSPLIVFKEADQLVALNEENYRLDEDGLIEFTRMILKGCLNFTPESLPGQVDGLSTYLGQEPKEMILDSFKNHSAMIGKEGVRCQFNVEKINIIKKSSPFHVEATGALTIYANGNNKSFPAVYLFEIKRMEPSKDNPYGLKVTQIVDKGQQSKGKKK